MSLADDAAMPMSAPTASSAFLSTFVASWSVRRLQHESRVVVVPQSPIAYAASENVAAHSKGNIIITSITAIQQQQKYCLFA